MGRHAQWHISGWLAVLLTPLALPVALLGRVFGILPDTPARLSASEIVLYIDDFLNGRGEPFDWDDFTSIKLADPDLDRIRSRAADVRLPVDRYGRLTLEELLREARALASKEA